jgi:biofilm PGA synthesis N-glycosyltransferase PgaC
VTPARNEAENLAVLAPTVIGQTVTPTVWVIVDDGSTDGTAALASELAARHAWIHLIHTGRSALRPRQGRREGRALLALQAGVDALDATVETVTKLDADVVLPPDYFERLLPEFAADPRLGLASGHRCELERGEWTRRHLPGTAVEAQCRTYRWAVWEALQPLEPRLGWDGIDEAKAVVSGWHTRVVPGLDFRHRRPMGTRDGNRLRARVAEGEAAQFMGYRPSYLLLRALWHARREPVALFMVWGYAAARVAGRSRCRDDVAVAHVRRQQSAGHLLKTFRQVKGHYAKN